MNAALTAHLRAAAAILALAALPIAAHAGAGETEATSWWEAIPEYTAPPIQRLKAERLAAIPAREAGQGAAVDGGHVYAVVNFAIGKYDKDTGARVGGWTGRRGGLIRHINSCVADGGRLICAHSNFPSVPMASSVEIFETQTMTHVASHSLGFALGSLTFIERHDGAWWAGFAHYDGKGGEPGRPARYASIARYDDEWRLTEQWLLPDTVLERLAPHAASGGSFGPDGLLYLTGHDRKEMYALALPDRGSVLVHLATIEIDIEGQAFSFDRSTAGRVVYGISRPNREIRAFSLPPVDPLPPEDRRPPQRP